MRKQTVLIRTPEGHMDLIQGPKGCDFLFVWGDEEGLDVDPEDGDPPVLRASEWIEAALAMGRTINLQDPLGLVTITADGLTVKGKTLRRRDLWTASLTEAGHDDAGEPLLEWESSRPLTEIELGKSFSVMIKSLGELTLPV